VYFDSFTVYNKPYNRIAVHWVTALRWSHDTSAKPLDAYVEPVSLSTSVAFRRSAYASYTLRDG
jgi:hypothetical protein